MEKILYFRNQTFCMFIFTVISLSSCAQEILFRIHRMCSVVMNFFPWGNICHVKRMLLIAFGVLSSMRTLCVLNFLGWLVRARGRVLFHFEKKSYFGKISRCSRVREPSLVAKLISLWTPIRPWYYYIIFIVTCISEWKIYFENGPKALISLHKKINKNKLKIGLKIIYNNFINWWWWKLIRPPH